MTARACTLVAALAAAVLLASCSNHSGLSRHRPTDSPTPAISLPAGLAGAPSSAASSATHSPSPSASRSATPSATPSEPASGSRAAAHGTNRQRSTAPRSSSSSRRGSTPPRTSSAPSGPAVGVSPGSGLKGGQTVTVSGVRFGPGERVEVRECRSNLTTCSVFSQTPSATATGAFSTRYTVSRNVALQSCGTSGCVIRVHRANGTNLAVPLRFG